MTPDDVSDPPSAAASRSRAHAAAPPRSRAPAAAPPRSRAQATTTSRPRAPKAKKQTNKNTKVSIEKLIEEDQTKERQMFCGFYVSSSDDDSLNEEDESLTEEKGPSYAADSCYEMWRQPVENLTETETETSDSETESSEESNYSSSCDEDKVNEKEAGVETAKVNDTGEYGWNDHRGKVTYKLNIHAIHSSIHPFEI